MTPDENHRLQEIEHRLSVQGCFMAMVFRRLGAPEALITDWHQAWRGGSLYQLYAAYNAIEAALKPPPRRRD